MNDVEQNLAVWRESLVTQLQRADLYARNPEVYKWKSMLRSWLVREASFWRVTDLLTQAVFLRNAGHGLGSRILIRSAFETLALLAYLNNKMREVVEGKIDFHQFCEATSRLSIGSRLEPTKHHSINVLTMLEASEPKYPGLRAIYDGLSESAHPNFEGLVWGYSKVDHEESQTNFSNRWLELYEATDTSAIRACMGAFYYEYDEVWPSLLEDLEQWVAQNNSRLQADFDARR